MINFYLYFSTPFTLIFFFQFKCKSLFVASINVFISRNNLIKEAFSSHHLQYKLYHAVCIVRHVFGFLEVGILSQRQKLLRQIQSCR